MISETKLSCDPLVTGRFQVAKLAMESLQHLDIKQRWEELDTENDQTEKAKSKARSISQGSCKTATPLHNYSPEADICMAKKPSK